VLLVPHKQPEPCVHRATFAVAAAAAAAAVAALPPPPPARR